MIAVTRTPRFAIGDQVTIYRGRQHVWTIRAIVRSARDPEPGYALSDGKRERTATESARERAQKP